MDKVTIVDNVYSRMNDDIENEKPKIEYEDSDIRKFYAGKSILLTGATGFMGKIYVEKILRECPDLKKLYVIVRQKRGVTQEEKMEKYFQNVIFDRLRKINPDFASKVVTIKGDLAEKELGLSASDRAHLVEEVDLIVHSGATTKFDEKVSVALRINVLATKYMLELAFDCKNVQAFVYVSTAYSHCYQRDIEEKFYEAPADLKTVYDIIAADTASKQGITEEAMKMLLGKWPNVYTFTKSMAEELVRQYGERANFACGVYRPSIVTATSKEPFAGWISGASGPSSIFMGVGLGFIHATHYLNCPMDLVPVDLSINSLIAVTYDLPDRWKREKRPIVYNYGSTTVAPIYTHKLYEHLYGEIEAIGSDYVVWQPFMIFTSSKFLFWIYHILFHFIPAVFADAFLLATGRKPRCLSLFWFGTKHREKAFYFSNGDWRIHVPEMMKVHERLNTTDRELFNFDLRGFDWATFTVNYTRGVRIYILKEDMSNWVKTKQHVRRLKKLHYFVTTIFGLLIAYYFYKVINFLLSAIF